uniref:K Homology domain-containing protein n=1 Tax=Lactuca sativa TaxID=4236 RepID=A0A9R1V1H5_LACSA|nr:hypothetical protein LSAT_V11C700364600 [Lactuca sativa]
MEAPLSSAMDGVIRLFKCVNGFPENESEGLASIPFCSSRLLLTSMQATSLIGNRVSSVNTIQQNIGCSVRILPSDEVSTLSANSDDRIVELKGEALKVRQALEAVHRHLHMFSVDHSIPPLFDSNMYIAWVSLRNKAGNKYDQSTNMFNLTDKEWETEIKKNKCIEELRDSPLRFPDLCAQLFDDGVDQALTEPGLSLPTLSPSHVTTTPSGEASLEPQAADALVPPSTQTLPPLPATETPAEPQKEPMVEVPPEMPQVQPTSEVVKYWES